MYIEIFSLANGARNTFIYIWNSENSFNSVIYLNEIESAKRELLGVGKIRGIKYGGGDEVNYAGLIIKE